MNNNDKYRCLICGTPYDTVREMADCIVRCDEKRKAEEAANEKKKLEQERRKELVEIEKTRQILFKQIKDYQVKHSNTVSATFSLKELDEFAKSLPPTFGLRW
ncbi:hypothetical protein [Anaerovorax sp. IOR16]|uniref:hypothetical protein n=1 Tax=Anaerovorax sp. IOR16 TaxID=2773458 RepID=UPI0019D30E96|nr:hypothetical protein [Anaerovorax sp. IOR16]